MHGEVRTLSSNLAWNPFVAHDTLVNESRNGENAIGKWGIIHVAPLHWFIYLCLPWDPGRRLRVIQNRKLNIKVGNDIN